MDHFLISNVSSGSSQTESTFWKLHETQKNNEKDIFTAAVRSLFRDSEDGEKRGGPKSFECTELVPERDSWEVPWWGLISPDKLASPQYQRVKAVYEREKVERERLQARTKTHHNAASAKALAAAEERVKNLNLLLLYYASGLKCIYEDQESKKP